MEDLKQAIALLNRGAYTCVLCRDDEVYTATARGVRPLVDWLDGGLDLRGFCAADKVVGRATAFLYILLGVRAVHANVMSSPARQVLEEHGIPASCTHEVGGIINRRGDGPCPFEETVLAITAPEEALNAIRKKQFQMRQPSGIRKHTEGRDFSLDRTGLSGSTVALFEDMVLKCEKISDESENHLVMLRWLEGKIPVPKVIESVSSDGYRWILMTRMSGEMSCGEAWRQDPHRLVRTLAQSLERLWEVLPADCPVDQRPAAKLRRAREIIERGAVCMDLVQPETFGPEGFSSPAALLQWLEENQPEADLVLSHGDLCLPNVFLDQWNLSGFLDLGRSGAGDRWNDIAILWRSLRDNFGGHYGEAAAGFHPDELFDALGIEKDEKKLKYYLLLDELF